jgi:hypothetical protein
MLPKRERLTWPAWQGMDLLETGSTVYRFTPMLSDALPTPESFVSHTSSGLTVVVPQRNGTVSTYTVPQGQILGLSSSPTSHAGLWISLPMSASISVINTG